MSKDACLHWCLDNHFELVELDPEMDDVDSEGGTFMQELLFQKQGRLVTGNLVLPLQHIYNHRHRF